MKKIAFRINFDVEVDGKRAGASHVQTGYFVTEQAAYADAHSKCMAFCDKQKEFFALPEGTKIIYNWTKVQRLEQEEKEIDPCDHCTKTFVLVVLTQRTTNNADGHHLEVISLWVVLMPHRKVTVQRRYFAHIL